jgi:hypothetical protein
MVFFKIVQATLTTDEKSSPPHGQSVAGHQRRRPDTCSVDECAGLGSKIENPQRTIVVVKDALKPTNPGISQANVGRIISTNHRW